MQIAFILSDLTSLRVCDHAPALALVSARTPSPSLSSQNSPTSASREQESATQEKIPWKDHDPDMQRATDLVELHYGVKVKHASGIDRKLVEARREVEEAMKRLRQAERVQGPGR